MAFHSASILAASLVFAVPFIDTCETVPSSDSGDGGDDGGGECVPQESEPECRSCLRISCCDGIQACEGDRACDCVVDCMSDSRVSLEACARARCDVSDVAAALEPLSRICAIDESCGGPRICEGTQELPWPQ